VHVVHLACVHACRRSYRSTVGDDACCHNSSCCHSETPLLTGQCRRCLVSYYWHESHDTTAPKGQTAACSSCQSLYGLSTDSGGRSCYWSLLQKKLHPSHFRPGGYLCYTLRCSVCVFHLLHSSGPLTPAWCARPCCSPAFIPHPCRARSLEYMPHPKVLTHRRGGGQL
jgi:hypothetical protein